MDFKMHEYTHALVGKVTPALRLTDRADLNDARRQFDCYLRLLRELNVEVIEVELGGSLPDNVFLEDIAIVCHGIAVLPKPQTSAEDFKIKAIKEILSKDLGQTVIEVSDPEAKILGSDVLFTGREFFVGICETSNEAGACAVAEAFPEFPCTPIKISKGAQHLKKYITVAGPDILCVGASKEAKEILKRMEREASFSYQTLTVPEDDAANCLYVNGTLIHRAIEEIPKSFKTPFADEALTAWAIFCPDHGPPKHPEVQKDWDDIRSKLTCAELLNDASSTLDLARLRAIGFGDHYKFRYPSLEDHPFRKY